MSIPMQVGDLLFLTVYSTLLVTCPVTSVILQIANYFWLTANPVMVLEISLIGLAVSKK